MRLKFYNYMAIVFTLCFLTCAASADVYNPGSEVETSFAEAIDSDAVVNTPSIRKTADLVVAFNREPAVVEERLTNGLSSLKEIVSYARQTLDPESALEGELLKSIESVWYQLLGRDDQNELMRPTNWEIDPNDFKVNLIPGELVLDFKTNYLDHVASTPDAYRDAIDALGILLLTQRTLNYTVRKNALEKVGAVARKRKKQWQVFFEQGIPQWPWELALFNGPIYENKLKHEKGLGKVPDWQLIVLHPEVALEYVDAAADGDQLRPALLVEIVGADLWSWKDGGKQKGPWGLPFPLGAGLVATFADRGDSDDWGFGGVIHFNHTYTIGATFRSGDTGFFISVNIAKLFEDKPNEAAKYLDLAGLQ